jgi:hypothetical protein
MAIKGAGGTTGGIGQFFLGLALVALGLYLFMSRVTVTTSLGSLFGGHAGLILLPLGLGVALLFLKARSIVGWVLTLSCFGLVFFDIVSNLTFLFLPTNIFRTIAMIAMMFVGLLMMARSLRAK